MCNFNGFIHMYAFCGINEITTLKMYFLNKLKKNKTIKYSNRVKKHSEMRFLSLN